MSDGLRIASVSTERVTYVTLAGKLDKKAQPKRSSSTNAARPFGLHPRKGTIRPGSDADLVLWDPDRERTIRRADVLSRAGFSVYEGTRVTGWPVLTLLRGRGVYRDGGPIGHPGLGRPLRRAAWRNGAV